MKKTSSALGIILMISLSSHSENKPVIAVLKLRCEYKENPIGMDVLQPRFSWQVSDSRRNTMQSAYQILISTSPENLKTDKGDVWDSKKINSSECIDIAYNSTALKSKTRYYWKVKIRDKTDKPSALEKKQF